MCIDCLTYDERAVALSRIDRVLTAIEKREAIPYEEDMFEVIYTGWIAASRRGLKAALEYINQVSTALTQDDLQAVISILRSEAGQKLAAGMSDDLLDLFGKAYLNGKAVALSEDIRNITFTLVDEMSIEWLQRNNLYWVGTYFDKHLSQSVADVVAGGMQEGLGRDEIGKLLKGFFKEYPGVQVRPDQYWSGLAATSMNRSRVFSSVNGYREVGIRELQILAMGDERVCPICEQLDRKIVPIQRAATQVQQMLATDNPEDVKAIAPWLAASEIADMSHEQIMNRGVILPPFHYSCFSDDTEVYSSRGWLKFSELDGSERFLSLHPETFDLEWLPAIRRIAQPYTGEMVQIRMKNFDLMVTPDHQLFYKTGGRDRGHKGGKWEFGNAGEMPAWAQFYRSSKWKGYTPATVTVGSLSLPTKLYCRFMGLYLTEGSHRKGAGRHEIVISQHHQDRKLAMYEALSALPAKVVKFSTGIRIHSQDLNNYVKQFGSAPEKFIPDEIKSFDPMMIREFLTYFQLGDGGVAKGRFWAGYQFKDLNLYRTSSKRMADDLGELILKVGRRPAYELHEQKGKIVNFKKSGPCRINTDCWIVSECIYQTASIRAGQQMAKRVTRIPYDGAVYCVELPRNHTLYVRRNGKCVWAGNCRCDVVAA